MKKKLLYAAAVLLCLSILGGTTLAYFSDSAVAHNVITSDGVQIALVEEMLDPSGNRVPFRNQSGLLPGQTASKIVSVKNLEAESWIRVKVTKSVTAADGKKLDDRYVTMDFSSDWLHAGDYYYYTKPVSPGAATTDLFTQVHFDGPGMTNDYQSSSVGIYITAQAVQTANNLPEGGARELTAANLSQVKGWPSELRTALAGILG